MLGTEPSANWIGLNRATFGARPEDLAQVDAMGWEGWVNDQLNVPGGDDAITDQLLAEATLHIEYPPSDPINAPFGSWDAVDEDRGFTGMNLGMRELWDILQGGNFSHPWDEVMRPMYEAYCSSYIRATSSAYQVREVMVDFWNNHFNIHAFDDGIITVAAPHYDRTVVRPNVFGNFRRFVEDVASHPAMLQYLDNAISEADLPNENYARELLELHTMGEDAYLGVSASGASSSDGFTDQDIIEASKALSGWTISWGQYIGDDETGDDQYSESTGEFLYNEQQHSQETGVFMGEDLSGLTAPMAQGQRVIELAAMHPATARFICTKICTRFFGENPPQAVVDAAVETWMANQNADDQIAQVVRTILLRNEFRDGPQTKFRRPYEQAIAYMRAVNARVTPNWQIQWSMQDTLDGLWTWLDPNGRPENNEFWITSSILRHMWWYFECLIACGAAQVTLQDELPAGAEDSIEDILAFYYERFYGYEPSSEVHDALVDDAFNWNGVMEGDMNNTEDREWRFRRLTALIATANEFVHR